MDYSQIINNKMDAVIQDFLVYKGEKNNTFIVVFMEKVMVLEINLITRINRGIL